MSRKITKKQKEFADAYLETGNGTQSALKAYDTEDYNTAHSIASENLQKPTVQEYLASKAEAAALMIFKLSQEAEAEPVRLNASKDILDRAGFKPVEKSITLNLDAELTESARGLGLKLLQRQRD